MSIEAKQIQETLYSYAAILIFTPSPQGLRAKFGACSVQNAQLLAATAWRPHMHTSFAYAFAYAIKQTPYAFVSKIILCMYLLYDTVVQFWAGRSSINSWLRHI